MPTYPPDKLPRTPSEVLATADIDPDCAKALEEIPIPPGTDWTISALKSAVEGSLPNVQARLAASRPPHLTETEHEIPVRDGWTSRTLVCRATNPSVGPSPLIVLYFGGGHCIGNPESELTFGRLLADTHNAVVVIPSYRLAPEFPFPYSVNDSWDILQYIATQAQNPSSSDLLPSFTDPKSGFIIGGTSAGANITSVLSHLARDNKLEPPVTGQALIAGGFMNPNAIPPKFKDIHLAREQNKRAPLLDIDLLNLFREAHKADISSPLWSSFDQHHPDDAEGEVKEGHKGLPPTYFQVCGLDMSRDDSLIFERVLREECQVQTRLDGYWGWPHCWWNIWGDREMSKRREQEGIDGVGWLLRGGRD